MTVKDIRGGLVSYMLADADILAMVGGSIANARVYPVTLQQGISQPSIVYHRISGQGDHHMEGPSGLAQARVQIDSWAKRHDQAVALANLIKARIDGAADVVLFGSNSPTDDITVQGIFFDSVREDRDDGADMFRVSQDFIVWYEER